MAQINQERLIGVYTITNISNGKKYVGASNNISRRRWEHFRQLKNNTHHNKHLQNAYNQSPEAFKFEIIYLCETREEAVKVEELYIETHDLVNSGYNQTYKAIFPATENISKGLLGTKLSEKHKESLRGPRPNMRGRKHFATKPFYQYNKRLELICIWYDGTEEFAKKFNMSAKSVRGCLLGKRNSCYGNIFSYKPLILN